MDFTPDFIPDLIKVSEHLFAFGQWNQWEGRYVTNPEKRSFRLWEAERRDVIGWCNHCGFLYRVEFVPDPRIGPNQNVPASPAPTLLSSSEPSTEEYAASPAASGSKTTENALSPAARVLAAAYEL